MPLAIFGALDWQNQSGCGFGMTPSRRLFRKKRLPWKRTVARVLGMLWILLKNHSFWMTFWLYGQWWCICWHFWCDGFRFSIKKTQPCQFCPWQHATMMILRSTLYLASTRSSMRSWWMPATIFSAIRNTWLTSRRLAFVLTTEIKTYSKSVLAWHVGLKRYLYDFCSPIAVITFLIFIIVYLLI